MKRKITVIAFVLVLLCVFLCGCKVKPYVGKNKADTLRGRSLQLGHDLINLYMYEIDGVPCVAQNVTTLFYRKVGVASVWHLTAVIAATNYLSEFGGEDGKYFSYVNERLWDSLKYYAGAVEICTYKEKAVQHMYAVNRANKPEQADISGINAVYDDQMWIVRELIAAYRRTGKTEYLTKAEALVKTCLDGWDYSLRPDGTEYGGIPWGAGYASKHTCSNAPLIAPLAALYEIYAETENEKAAYYLDFAVKIYNFCRDTFVNDDGLYGDLIGTEYETRIDGTKKTTSHGSLDQTAYTYNTGTMLQAAAKLYYATKDEQYISYARTLSDVSYDYFLLNKPGKHSIYNKENSNAWFDFQLLLGYIELRKIDDGEHLNVVNEYIDHMENTLSNAYDNFYSNGLLPNNLGIGWEFESKKDVLDSAAYVEMLAVLAMMR